MVTGLLVPSEGLLTIITHAAAAFSPVTGERVQKMSTLEALEELIARVHELAPAAQAAVMEAMMGSSVQVKHSCHLVEASLESGDLAQAATDFHALVLLSRKNVLALDNVIREVMPPLNH